MTIEGDERAISDEFYQAYWADGGVADKYFNPNELEEARRADLEDTFVHLRARAAELFPEITDPALIDKVVAVCSIFERLGFESGVLFANTAPVVRRDDQHSTSRAFSRLQNLD